MFLFVSLMFVCLFVFCLFVQEVCRKKFVSPHSHDKLIGLLTLSRPTDTVGL